MRRSHLIPSTLLLTGRFSDGHYELFVGVRKRSLTENSFRLISEFLFARYESWNFVNIKQLPFEWGDEVTIRKGIQRLREQTARKLVKNHKNGNYCLSLDKSRVHFCDPFWSLPDYVIDPSRLMRLKEAYDAYWRTVNCVTPLSFARCVCHRYDRVIG